MIRELTVDELPLLYRVGREFYREGKIPGKFIETVFRDTWAKLIQSGTGHCFGAFHKGEMVGALGCLVYPDLYNGDKVSVESFWYVFGEYRGQGARLMLHYERWAKEQGIKRIMMGAIAGLHDEELGSFYGRCGYQRLETVYIKSL